MRLISIVLASSILGAACSSAPKAPAPAAPPRDNVVSPWFQVVARRADVAAYPAGAEHVLVVPQPDRNFVVVRVLNYPKARPLLAPSFVPAVPAPDQPPAKPLSAVPQFTEVIVLFDSDAFRLSPQSRRQLDELVAKLGNAIVRSEIRVVGHADSVGSDTYNQALSMRRATAVRDYLVGKGAQASRVTASAMGERSPVATNDSEIGRASNRRAVVRSSSTVD